MMCGTTWTGVDTTRQTALSLACSAVNADAEKGSDDVLPLAERFRLFLEGKAAGS